MALAAIASALAVADRAAAVSINFTKIKMDYKPQDDKDRIIILDPSTNPPTPVQNFDLVLQDAGVGTPQNPLGPLPLATTIAIDNPDPAGLGDAVKIKIINVSTTHDDEAPQESFVVVRTPTQRPRHRPADRHEEGHRQVLQRVERLRFVVSGQAPGQPEIDYLLRGDIDPTQTGLTLPARPTSKAAARPSIASSTFLQSCI